MVGWPHLTDIESAPLTGNVELSRNHKSQPGGALTKRSSKYVGLDVHQATTVTTVREESGRVLARSVVPTEAAALVTRRRAAQIENSHSSDDRPYISESHTANGEG